MNADATAPIQRRRLSHAEQIADRCVHFNGVMNDRCGAGVAYSDVRVDHAPIAYQREGGPVYTMARSFPCLASHNLGGAVCEKRCAPTPEQVAAEEAESTRSIESVLKARAAIVDATKGKRGVGGTMLCPVCTTGTLAYTVAGSNGHIHARCSTEACVAWME